MIETRRLRALGAAVAVGLLVMACGPGGGATTRPGGTAAASPRPASPGAQSPGAQSPAAQSPAGQSPGAGGSPTGDQYTIGFSNSFGVGNGFREEQLCTAKAQALVSGQVSNGTWIHRDTDAAGQLADIRTLVAQGVDAIVFNPIDPEALNPALDEAQAAGIVTVAIDAYVTDPETYNISNDQVAYARIGAEWLFEHLGGEGRVWYTRGIAGHPADNDRHQGVMEALENYPNIELFPNEEGVHTGWNPTTATDLANQLVASPDYDTIDGVWTSGMDQQVVDAIQAAGKPFVPIVGADLKGFVGRLLEIDGLEGLAVYNPASVGGAGVELALRVLNDEEIETTTRTLQDASGNPVDINAVFLPEPPSYDNVTDEGRSSLEEIYIEELDDLWPVSWEIPSWTEYTFEQMHPSTGCKGPGEV